MYRLTNVIVSLVLTLYTTASAAYGVFSTSWWTGPGNYQIGIATNCAQTYNATVVDSNAVQFCTDFQWDAYAKMEETAMAGLLIVAAILGLICLFMMVMNIWMECCCKFKAPPVVSLVLTAQAQLLLAPCIIMAIYYNFTYPKWTDSLGLAYILVIVAIPMAFVSAFLIKRHRTKTVFLEAEGYEGKTY
ncbi:hypothetical protein SARC_03933 [Sphaeroforma arctica JP610]|uniref:Uncharacterized protein n=1 Tax=Sphaeroforma arctica JP610 TaxID=667725 RepID=A0A0L0G4U4_9EUKA|nr:hypothetical protein SARC_03933 [Sphaeroforma arctica JP610]KNC83826.1 hypothetical protein SARC_03933 [Sphaeroforma arctica JP610]|eukprot:XP_014157728.1 hypothetical protein SARC_03933 [Sphaeroforma arctica JP610]